MKIKDETVFTIMHVLTWVVFIGLCIKTGALFFSIAVSILINAEAAGDLYLGLDLRSVYNYSKIYYINIATLVVAICATKAIIAYQVIKIFLKMDLANPFSAQAAKLIANISHYALGAAVVSIIAESYTKGLVNQGLQVSLQWNGSEFLFMAGILFIIAKIFNKGVELQSENDLTI